MIRLSAGTAACLGLASAKMDFYPTTAYLLSGDSCRMSCSFCPRGSGGNEALTRLGRISWPEYPWADVERVIGTAEEKGISRICLQSVRHADGIRPLLQSIEKLKALTTLPLSLSAWIMDEDEAAMLIAAGVERISVSLDVVNAEAFEKIKGGSLKSRLDLLLQCARTLPGRISTHIICGLGESEAEALSMIDRLIEAGVTVALFAFVPLKGTKMEKAEPPPLDAYRRIQAGYYLLNKKLAPFSGFCFENGRLVSFGLPAEDLPEILASGEAFQTSGCPGCNRPYYNERPGRTIYNYHRPLSPAEAAAAVNGLTATLKE
jgi:lipoyl synthase